MKDKELQQKTLLRPKEASERFSVPLSTIYLWFQLGKIDGVNVNGRSLRIFSKSLMEMLELRKARKDDLGVFGQIGDQASHLSSGCPKRPKSAG